MAMKTEIDDIRGDSDLGSTPEGRAWCFKALHPADTGITSASIPTKQVANIASLDFNQLDVLSMPASFDPTKVWSLKIYVLRDPIILYAYKMEQEGRNFVSGCIINKQFSGIATEPGATYYETVFRHIRRNCERFRLTAQSITGYFDGASLSDQGHVVVGQTEYPRMKVNNMGDVDSTDYSSVPADSNIIMGIPMYFYQDPLPERDNILQTTDPYQGDAKEGFYAPSKLRSVGEWIYTNQSYAFLGSGRSLNNINELGNQYYISGAKFDQFIGSFPYAYTEDVSGPNVPMTFKQTDSGLTSIFYTGISATSSLRITMRWCMDMIVRPGTLYAPFVKSNVPDDPLAINMYYEVARRLKDGYPSNHNNLAFLAPIIRGMAATVGPTILNNFKAWAVKRIDAKKAKGSKSRLELLVPDNPLTAEEETEVTNLRAIPVAQRNQVQQARIAELENKYATLRSEALEKALTSITKKGTSLLKSNITSKKAQRRFAAAQRADYIPRTRVIYVNRGGGGGYGGYYPRRRYYRRRYYRRRWY